jgi:hypothetical protein
MDPTMMAALLMQMQAAGGAQMAAAGGAVTNAYYFCFALNVFAINKGARLDTRRGRCVVYFNR